jgi:hypothetical protein
MGIISKYILSPIYATSTESSWLGIDRGTYPLHFRSDLPGFALLSFLLPHCVRSWFFRIGTSGLRLYTRDEFLNTLSEQDPGIGIGQTCVTRREFKLEISIMPFL